MPILLTNNFTLYMIAGERTALSLICSVAGGILNMVLDYVLIAGLDMRISGVAIATGLGYSVTAVVGLVVFCQKKNLLHFGKSVIRLKVLVNAAANGCSEMAAALVTGIITMMFNWTMLMYVGEDGGHHHHVCADVCKLPLYGVFLRRGSDDKFLSRGTEFPEAGWDQHEGYRGNLWDYGCGFPVSDKAALLFIGVNIFASGMFTGLVQYMYDHPEHFGEILMVDGKVYAGGAQQP